LLFSGGLDSFYLAATLRPKRYAHFLISPTASFRALKQIYLLDPEAYVLLYDHRPFLRKMLEDLKKYKMERFLCLACKRGMVLRASEHGRVVIGDSLGQVASQTLSNAHFISSGAPVARPLFGSDKEDLEHDHPLKPLAEAVSTLKCPFKPDPVATRAPTGKLRRVLDYLIGKNLHFSRKLGMWKASDLTAMG